MDKATLTKLSKNPHYKMTAAQKATLGIPEEDAEYGVLPKHDSSIPKHPTELPKKAR